MGGANAFDVSTQSLRRLMVNRFVPMGLSLESERLLMDPWPLPVGGRTAVNVTLRFTTTT